VTRLIPDVARADGLNLLWLPRQIRPRTRIILTILYLIQRPGEGVSFENLPQAAAGLSCQAQGTQD
jgi:hypothetical protein